MHEKKLSYLIAKNMVTEIHNIKEHEQEKYEKYRKQNPDSILIY